MPQLMPLNWQFSFMAIFLLVLSSSYIYSFNLAEVKVGEMVKSIESNQNLWCW